MENWDSIIVGGGAAGLTAGIYGVRSGLKTLILEEKKAGGTTADAPLIENYPGFSSITGQELINKFLDHCRKFEVKKHELEKVISIEVNNEKKVVKTAKALYQAQAVIIASGCHYRKLGVPGEEKFRGRGVSYCAVCDGHFFKDKRVLVVGGGNSAAITALYLAGLASEVKLSHRRAVLRAEKALGRSLEQKGNVEILWNTELKQINGEKTVKRVTVFNNKTNERKKIETDGVFIQVGEVPNSQPARSAGVNVNREGYIIVDVRQQTNIPGIYAAGDVTNHPVKQVGTAVGQGITAALEAYGYIRQPYYHRE